MKTVSQKLFPRQLFTPAHRLQLVLAAVLIVMLFMQLFTFERFPTVLKELGIPGGARSSVVVAIAMVIAELMSLPWLLGVSIRPLTQRISRWMVLVTAYSWLILTAWGMGGGNDHANSGLLGDTIYWPVGFLALTYALGLALIATAVVAGRSFFDTIKQR